MSIMLEFRTPPYNLKIKHIKGSDTIFADYISQHVG